MYKRTEEIEEESLDWKEQGKQPQEEVNEVKVNVPFGVKHKKSFQHKQIDLSQKLVVKKNVTDLIDANGVLFSIATILIIPYILGFVITFLLYSFYGGMTISGFFTIDKEYLPLQLWSIGHICL